MLAEQNGKCNFPKEYWIAYRIPRKAKGNPASYEARTDAHNPAWSVRGFYWL